VPTLLPSNGNFLSVLPDVDKGSSRYLSRFDGKLNHILVKYDIEQQEIEKKIQQ
jgi:hypothetical protein